MITFREINYEKDIDQIIDLLNANFPTLHTKEAFLWKHYDNPFGKSYGLLAVDGEKIAGLRMFMRWEFLCDNRTIRAIRPVDTCTDHSYRGQGLFKKITLQGLENIKDEYELIFNTPNENSKPGYLKMGWKQIERGFHYKVGMINFFKKARTFEEIASDKIGFREDWFQGIKCQTRISKEYLGWRFRDPRYRIAQFKDGGIVIYKLSKIKKVRTVILLDTFGDEEGRNQRIHSVCIENGAKFLYYLDNLKNKNLKLFPKFKRGVQTVVWKDDVHHVHDQIMFTVGDLEGRL